MSYPAPAQKQKSWFARHKILTAILVIIVIGIIASMGSGGDGDEPKADSNNSAASSSDRNADTNDDGGDGDAAVVDAADGKEAEEPEADEPEEAEEPAESAPGVGDTVSTGNFDVTITSVDAEVGLIGNEHFNAEAAGQFVLVHVSVTNTGNEAEHFRASEHKLIDEQDRQHSESSDAWYYDGETFAFTEVNPGNTVEGALIYDIPADSVPTAIDLGNDEFFGDPIRVSLQ